MSTTTATQLEYPLSPKYIPEWTVTEALRELISNALDTKTSPRVKYRNKNGGEAVISDSAAGIPRSFWVIGEGNHGEIGQFGEGLKMAMLVLARERRSVTLSTAGYSVQPSLAHSDVYESTVLVLDFQPNSRQTGTEITIPCSYREYTNARDRFLKFTDVKSLCPQLGIVNAPGSLYINGVFAQQVLALWGYNITNKELANRDRSVLNMQGVRNHIEHMVGRLSNENMIMELLTEAHGDAKTMESQVWPYLRNKVVWKRAFYKVFGPHACLLDNAIAARSAQGLGYKVVNVAYGLKAALSDAGVQTATKTLKSINRKPTALATPLTPTEERILQTAKDVARAMIPDARVAATKVVEEFPGDNPTRCITEGMYRGKTVYLRRSCLESLGKAIGVLLHERAHGLGYMDEDRNFESFLTDLMGRLSVTPVLSY